MPLAERWLLGTHQGSVNSAHLPSYLDEFVFRFNRRHARSRGMLFYRVLELAVAHEPVRYRDFIANPKGARTRQQRRSAADTRPALTAPPPADPGDERAIAPPVTGRAQIRRRSSTSQPRHGGAET